MSLLMPSASRSIVISSAPPLTSFRSCPVRGASRGLKKVPQSRASVRKVVDCGHQILSVQEEPREDTSTRKVALLAGLLASAFTLQQPDMALAKSCDLQEAGDLQYCDIRVGKGDGLKTGDYVEVAYLGTDVETRDVFDSTPQDEPFEFYLGDDEVIPGWEQGMVGVKGMPPMRYGGVRKLLIPAKLAYGSQGYGCKYDLTGRERGGMKCLVNPGGSIELVVGVLEQ